MTAAAMLYLDAGVSELVRETDGSVHGFPGPPFTMVARSVPSGAEATEEQTLMFRFPSHAAASEVTFTLKIKPFVYCEERYIYRYRRLGTPQAPAVPKPKPPEKPREAQPRILSPQGLPDSQGYVLVERGLIPITMIAEGDPKLNLEKRPWD